MSGEYVDSAESAPRTMHDVFWNRVFTSVGLWYADIKQLRSATDRPDIVNGALPTMESYSALDRNADGITTADKDDVAWADKATLSDLRRRCDEYVHALQELRVETRRREAMQIKVRSFVEEKRYEALRSRELQSRVTPSSVAGCFAALDLSAMEMSALDGVSVGTVTRRLPRKLPPADASLPAPRVAELDGTNADATSKSERTHRASLGLSTRKRQSNADDPLAAIDPHELLADLTRLRTLNVSRNRLTEVTCPLPAQLQTLIATNNMISTFSPAGDCSRLVCLSLAANALTSCAFVSELPSLRVLDVSFNRIANLHEAALAIHSQSPRLADVFLRGNPISLLSHYRKTFLHGYAYLTLDDFAASESETQAWVKNLPAHHEQPARLRLVITECRNVLVVTAPQMPAAVAGAVDAADARRGGKPPIDASKGGGKGAKGGKDDPAAAAAGGGGAGTVVGGKKTVAALTGSLAGVAPFEVEDVEAAIAAAHPSADVSGAGAAATKGPAKKTDKGAAVAEVAAVTPQASAAAKLMVEIELSDPTARHVDALIEPHIIALDKREVQIVTAPAGAAPVNPPATSAPQVAPVAAPPAVTTVVVATATLGYFIVDASSFVTQAAMPPVAESRKDGAFSSASAGAPTEPATAAPAPVPPGFAGPVVNFSAPLQLEQAWVCQRRDAIRRLRQQLSSLIAADKSIDKQNADAMRAPTPVQTEQEKPVAGKKAAGAGTQNMTIVRKAVSDDNAHRREESQQRKAEIEELTSRVDKEEKYLARVLKEAETVVLVGTLQLLGPTLEMPDALPQANVVAADSAKDRKKK